MKKAGIVFLILLMTASLYLWFDHHRRPAEEWQEKSAEERRVEVSAGSSLEEIADKLFDKGVIRSRHLFKIYARLQDMDRNMQAGVYKFSRNQKVGEIVEKIGQGRVYTERLAVPEGSTVEEIASRAASNLKLTEDEFLQEARRSAAGRDYLPDSDRVQYRVEGFLYPTTYLVPYDIDPGDLIDTMLDRFEEKWLDEIESFISERDNFEESRMNFQENWTIREVVVLASLIEKEAVLPEEKPVIAGVILNRLKDNMRLQIDATVQYALTERKERLMYSDLEVDSPYNTYLYSGLPPGPIASPGDEAIKAAVEPDNNDYLFFFARGDGSHEFTKSYQEHLKRQRKLLD